MIKKFSVDRIENQFAVCIDDNGNVLNIALKDLSSDVKEGDVLVLKNDVFCVDRKETDRRREEVRSLLDELFQ